MAEERYRAASAIGDGTVPDFLTSSFPNSSKPLSHKYLTKKISMASVISVKESEGKEGMKFEKEIGSIEMTSRTPYSYPTESLRKSSGGSKTGGLNQNSSAVDGAIEGKSTHRSTKNAIIDDVASSKFSFESGVSSTINAPVTKSLDQQPLHLEPIKYSRSSENLPLSPQVMHKKLRKPPPHLQTYDFAQTASNNTSPPSSSTSSPNSSSSTHLPAVTIQKHEDHPLASSTSQATATATATSQLSSTRKFSPTTIAKQFTPDFPAQDPNSWTLDRVLLWLRHYQFNDSWIATFQKHQLFGGKFLKLTTYEEINKFKGELETYDELSSAARFIGLLRKTLGRSSSASAATTSGSSTAASGGMIPTSRRSLDLPSNLEVVKSNGVIHGRSTSESAPPPAPKVVDMNHQRVGSLSSVTDELVKNKKTTEKTDPKTRLRPVVTTESGGNGSSSFSRSSLSVLGTSSKQRPLSAFDIPHKMSQNSSTTNSNNSAGSSRASALFKRNNRSTDMNSLFSNSSFSSSSSHLPMSSSTIASTPITTSSASIHTLSHESTSDKKPKDSLFSKWRRHKSKDSSGASIKDMLNSPISPSISSLESPSSSSTNNNANIFVIDKKYQPISQMANSDKYVLITLDNENFKSLNIGSCSTVDQFYHILETTYGLVRGGYTVHLTDFGFEPGLQLTKEVIDGIVQMKFLNISGKLLIRSTNTRSMSLPKPDIFVNDESHSLMSLGNTSASSFETNSYDTISQLTNETGGEGIEGEKKERVKRYPNTPLHYYEEPKAVDGGDYMSFTKSPFAAIAADVDNSALTSDPEMEEYFKRRAEQEAKMIKLKRSASKTLRKPPPPPTTTTSTNSAITTKPKLASLDTSKSSFRILRPVDRVEIDFDKRRESPFTKSANSSPINTTPTSSTNSKATIITNTDVTTAFLTKPTLYFEDTKYSVLPKLDPVKEGVSGLNTPISNMSSPSPTTVLPIGSSSSSVYTQTPPTMQSPETMKQQQQETEPGSSSLQRSARVQSLRRFKSIRRAPSVKNRELGNSANANDLSFHENEISFADVPELSSSNDDEDDDDCNTTEDFWVQNTSAAPTITDSTTATASDGTYNSFGSDISDLSTLRPGRDVLYDNIEQFFPGDVLDRPVLQEQDTPPPSPMNNIYIKKKPQLKRVVSSSFKDDDEVLKPRRTKTIRAVVREARLRENSISNSKSSLAAAASAASANKVHGMSSDVPKISTQVEQLKRAESNALLRRRSTRMWGKSVTEVKHNQPNANDHNNLSRSYNQNNTSSNVSKIRRNINGEIEDYQWVKGKLIGRGTFGEVYLALNVTTGEMIAVKQVRIHSQPQDKEHVIDALKSEVDTLKDLDHVNVVQYLGFEKTETEYNLFLEYIAGGSVASCLQAHGRFEEPLVRSITTQVLSGLAYLHSKGILHRDMKADNLLIDLDGVCKITDFGISTKSNRNAYDNFVGTSMKGTIFWMAPEVVDSQGEGYSAKVDIWSLGCVVLEMFAGKRPWEDYEMVQAMFKIGKDRTPPPIPQETRKFISQFGLKFFEKCWTIDPVMRPTAQELLNDIFCSEPDVIYGFDFSKTALAALIKSRKGNSSGQRSD